MIPLTETFEPLVDRGRRRPRSNGRFLQPTSAASIRDVVLVTAICFRYDHPAVEIGRWQVNSATPRQVPSAILWFESEPFQGSDQWRGSLGRSIEELTAGIAERHDELDSFAAAAEELGTAPAGLVDVMRELRVPLVKAPTEVGGDRLSMADQLRYFEALSYANPTAGWTGFNHAGAAGMCGARLTDEGVETVFGSGAPPFIAAVSNPSGTFRFVEGGLELTGRYRYASGVAHADWVMLGAVEDGDRGSVRLALVDRADVDTAGSWEVMALKGTGSLDVAPDGVFVPSHLTVDPLAGTQRGGSLYRCGYQAYVSAENLGFTLGVCQRFFDELTAYAAGKSRGPDGILANRGAFQYELGKGQLQVNAARAYGLQSLDTADLVLGHSDRLSPDEEQEIVAMTAFATESAVNAVSHLFHFAGAGALFSSNILQRLFRDAHGSVQHHVASNVAYDRYGQRRLAGVDEQSTNEPDADR